MCHPSSNFCAENLRKNLKRVQDERWGLEFSHTLAQCGGESCYKIVGRESLPCCAYMFCACCGPISTTQNNLVPIWANLPRRSVPKSNKVRPKSAQKSKRTCLMLSMPFLIDLGSILDRFLNTFGHQVVDQINQKIDQMGSCWQVGRNCRNT